MRLMCFLAGVLLATSAHAQEASQRELNALTGAPADTRCFQSMAGAQEMAKHYVASGLCPQLSPIHPAEFMEALELQKIADDDFASEACQVQLKLMFRAGREWINEDPGQRCPAAAQEMRKQPHLRGYVR